MHHHNHHFARHGMHRVARDLPQQPDMVPTQAEPLIVEAGSPTMVKRSESTCGSSGECEKPTSTTTTTTLPVVLGAVVPIVCAIIVLIYLHRRNTKKLRSEDANDKHRSLDFGMDLGPTKGSRQMREAEKGNGGYHTKGISLDIGPSPYLLPPGLHGSQESFNSLSRSISRDGDKYRPVAFPPKGKNPPPRGYPDDTASLGGGALGDDMNQGLLGNAQRMSRSSPPLCEQPEPHMQSPVHGNDKPADLDFQFGLPRSPSPAHLPGAAANTPRVNEDGVHGSMASPPPQINLPSHDLPPNHPEPEHGNLYTTSIPTPRISLPLSDAGSDYDNKTKSNPSIPAVNIHGVDNDTSHGQIFDHPPVPPVPEEPQAQMLNTDSRRDTRRMTLGLRPLPPEDATEDPEQRANRIRSFYKEYFDDSKANRETVYEDDGNDFYPDPEGDYIYDPYSGQEYYDPVPAPFAEPVSRRAMTPPPRAPPRFQGGPGHMASGSLGGYSDQFMPPGPRAFSSASNRMPGPRAPRRPVPPPAPLQNLPTPHMLKDDSFMTAMDFAPGKSFKDQREGRSETPLGGMRPFSPGSRAHTPLASAFDELSVIPSPFALRKSGTFDNLDFAPPPRFKNTEAASDAGSIRSNGTGVSIAHLNNIRTGAYRVSRLPPETVGTKDDLMSSLRPAWDMRT
ncbi:hypothetical protein P168DRAFT_240736 [Aspergillus campestris IBT 28561]|uniref:Uncharacterized protein n=1 Tax=Aspergillus campestris (strain IBT 28561) TaxID=1392248 RepID=A0A2I1CW57_ASPC2|nr:uncharacterized protein P168DRAFT_240736 [Aspergillus campestris IBT 28561]PKY01861.1 hypothetical protein P168DRAFT_240736 [Aspergillus campestris IBT 28561]